MESSETSNKAMVLPELEAREEWPQVIQPAAPPPLKVLLACQECGAAVSREDAINISGMPICIRCGPVFFQRMRQGTVDLTRMRYARFLSRAGARIIDWMLLGMVQSVAQYAVMHALGMDRLDQFAVMVVTITFSIGAVAGSIVYSTLMVGWCGMTLGKMACGIRVVCGDGTPVSYKRALGRACADFISAMVLYVGYIMPLFDTQRRALHDFICDTRVVEVAS